MVGIERQGEQGTLVVLLHWLGGSSRSWTEVSEDLSAAGFHCVAIDLPGFGASANEPGYSIAAMVAVVVETVRGLRNGATERPWVLAGHSMGGKLAALIARASAEGEPGLENLRGVVLLSPSPPGPEPMQESKRDEMLRSLGPSTREADVRRANAETFVDDNTGRLPLLEPVRDRSVADVLRMNPQALAAWLQTGSREDDTDQVGVLSVPALILAGTEEKALGPKAQQQHTLPHFSHATLVALEGGGHLAPLERPWEVSDRMVEFFHQLGLPSKPTVEPLGEAFAGLIASDRTSPQTRSVLLERLNDVSEKPGIFAVEELRTLRALAARVVPNVGFDLAARVDQALAQAQHDGWRFSALPEDSDAWQRGLASLDAAAKRTFGVPFVALDGARQNEMLKQARNGELGRGLLASLHLGEGAKLLDAAQMRDWFEDVRGELVKLYVADPRTMERIGFTGFADEKGFTQIKLAEREEAEI